jgi:undecaprenyl-diphosphatase
MSDGQRSWLGRFFSWVGGHELTVLLAIAGVAGGIWIFVLLASQVTAGGMKGIDQKILLAMRKPDDRSPRGSAAIQEAARDITALGGITVLGLMVGVTSGFLALNGRRRMAVFLFCSVTSGAIASSTLKLAVDRARPDLVPHATYVSDKSFPSGHSMISAITYLSLGALLARSQQKRRLKAYVLLVAVMLTVLVGVTRVYLGVHWPTDVMAGWTAGAVWALGSWLTARWLQRRRAIERETVPEDGNGRETI